MPPAVPASISLAARRSGEEEEVAAVTAGAVVDPTWGAASKDMPLFDGVKPQQSQAVVWDEWEQQSDSCVDE